MSSFLSSIASKAQGAINAHLPSSSGRAGSPDPASQPSANQAATGQGLGSKNLTIESIKHQFRELGQQYSSTGPVQKMVTNEKGVAIDFEKLANDNKLLSKEMYMWGQKETTDIQDVTDRLAYLNFVHGSLASTLANKLSAARAPLKSLRDAETALAPRRTNRANLRNQIGRLEHEQAKGMEKRLAEFREQLHKAEIDDEPLEKEVELLKRRGIKESEALKWEALREYGEKLSLLAQASTPILEALPTIPPSSSSPYGGASTTAVTRASLQRALDNYQTGQVHFERPDAATDLSRSDTRSFGESHASELSSLASADDDVHSNATTPGLGPKSVHEPNIGGNVAHGAPNATTGTTGGYQLQDPGPVSRSPVQSPVLATSSPLKSGLSVSSVQSDTAGSGSINPLALNNTPADIPPRSAGAATSPVASPAAGATAASPGPVQPDSSVNVAITAPNPTVAETGVPVSGGGPASGSLRDLKSDRDRSSTNAAVAPTATNAGSGFGGGSFGSPAAFETAEQEKARLQREDRERILAQGGSTPSTAPSYPSAGEEKEELERRERERILHGESQAPSAMAPDNDNEDNQAQGPKEDLPPYQPM